MYPFEDQSVGRLRISKHGPNIDSESSGKARGEPSDQQGEDVPVRGHGGYSGPNVWRHRDWRVRGVFPRRRTSGGDRQ